MNDKELLDAIGRSTSMFESAKPRRMYCVSDGEYIGIFVSGENFPVAHVRFAVVDRPEGPLLMVDGDSSTH